MSIAGKGRRSPAVVKGIGRAIALRLARDGADVGIADLDDEKANAVADDIRTFGHRSLVTRTDVEGILAFAERVLPKASDLWVHASLDQRQRLAAAVFSGRSAVRRKTV